MAISLLGKMWPEQCGLLDGASLPGNRKMPDRTVSGFPGRFSAGRASASCRPFRHVQQWSRVFTARLAPWKGQTWLAARREACVNSYLGEGNGLEDTEDRRSAGGHGNQHVRLRGA